MELAERVAIVTGAGGAGVGGLGVTYAWALARRGARVVINDVDGAAADRVAKDLRADGLEAVSAAGDVADEDAVRSVVDVATDRFGGVDILVNNAGLARGKWSEALELSTEDWKTILAVNTLGPLLAARACRESMSRRGGGVIVNQSSMGAYGEAGAYSVTKLALVGLTKVLAAELGGENIRVNAIAPGMMTAKLPPDQVAAFLAQQKLARQGRPEDLVGTLLYLCSDASSFVTGQTILVDGGCVRGHV